MSQYDQPCSITTRGERFSPTGHFNAPRIQEGHLEVASTHTPNGMQVAAPANITTVAGTTHHMTG
jgi:hypothetical protein